MINIHLRLILNPFRYFKIRRYLKRRAVLRSIHAMAKILEIDNPYYIPRLYEETDLQYTKRALRALSVVKERATGSEYEEYGLSFWDKKY